MSCLNISDTAIITVKSVTYSVLFMTLANLKQPIYLKGLSLMIIVIYQKYISEQSMLRFQSATIILTIWSKLKYRKLKIF